MSSPQPPLATKKRTFRRMKQFRCEGYGDCGMVFSRGEHLARHVRKHTGEKPYKCEFPDCDKKFSRFDNMRQHAQTHLRLKKQQHNNNAEEVPIQPRLALPPSYTYFPLAVGPDQMNPPQTAATIVCPTASTSPSLIRSSAINNNHNSQQHGLVSPVSLSGTFEEHHQHQDNNVKQEEPQDIDLKPQQGEATRCKYQLEQQQQQQQQQQPEGNQNLHGLTQDELDALDGLNQFRQSPQSTTGSATNNETD